MSKQERKKDFIGFYVEPEIKEKLLAIAAEHGCTMSDLMTAFAEKAETLFVFLEFPVHPLSRTDTSKESALSRLIKRAEMRERGKP